jgi:hypothetical protein
MANVNDSRRDRDVDPLSLGTEGVHMPSLAAHQARAERFVYVGSTREAVESTVTVGDSIFDVSLLLGVPDEKIDSKGRFRSFFSGYQLASWEVTEQFCAILVTRSASGASPFASSDKHHSPAQIAIEQFKKGVFYQTGLACLHPGTSDQVDSTGELQISTIFPAATNPGYGTLYMRLVPTQARAS